MTTCAPCRSNVAWDVAGVKHQDIACGEGSGELPWYTDETGTRMLQRNDRNGRIAER